MGSWMDEIDVDEEDQDNSESGSETVESNDEQRSQSSSNRSESDYICGEKQEDGKVCTQDPSYSDGKCGAHTESLEVNRGGTGEEVELDDWEFGIEKDRSRYYRKLPDPQKSLIDRWLYGFVARAPFDPTHEGKVEMLRQVCIDMHKRRRGNEIIDNEGMTLTSTSDYIEEFGTIEEEKEHPIHLTVDRLARTNIRTLKELGLLGESPDSQSADAQKGLVDLISSVNEEAESVSREEAAEDLDVIDLDELEEDQTEQDE